jgi:hypothetical protein
MATVRTPPCPSVVRRRSVNSDPLDCGQLRRHLCKAANKSKSARRLIIVQLSEGGVSLLPSTLEPTVAHSKSNGEDTSQRELTVTLHEMAEALQAVTNYVAAAQRIAGDGSEESTRRLCEMLEKATIQTLRVNKAFRLVRAHADDLERS